MVPKQNCAFVTFTTRQAAEAAADGTFNKLVIKQQRLKILWGKAQGQAPVSGDGAGSNKLPPVAGLRKNFCLFWIRFMMYIRILYWRDTSYNTLDYCIRGMHLIIHPRTIVVEGYILQYMRSNVLRRCISQHTFQNCHQEHKANYK